jgi:hypothetical protein
MSGELVPLYVIIFCFVDDVCPAWLLLLLVVSVRLFWPCAGTADFALL